MLVPELTVPGDPVLLLGLFAQLFGALAAGDFGIRGERPINFDSIALLQSVIRPGQSAEDTERGIR